MKVSVPDLGDFADVEIIEVLVKVGDRVAPEDPIVTLETDKATMDVPSPAAGLVSDVKVAVGDRVSTGDDLVVLEDGEELGAAAQAGGNGASAPAGPTPAEPPEAAEPETTRSAEAGSASTPTAGGAPPGGAQAPPAERPVLVPDLGDFSDVEIIEVLVREGEEVEAEQGLVTLETEKATMDVPAPAPGTIVSLRVSVGDRVSAGDEIMTLRPRLPAAGEASPAPAAEPEASSRAPAAEPEAPSRPAPAAEPEAPSGPTRPPASRPAPPADRAAERAGRAAAEPAAAREGTPAPPATAVGRGPQGLPIVSTRVDEAGFARVHASPSIRKLARELGVDLARVPGSGVKGRITADDVKAFVKEIMRGGRGGRGEPAWPAVPEVDFAKFGEVELEPLSRIRRISGARVHASWVNIPHVTQHDEADITELEQTRASLKQQAEERGIRLTPLAFILRACALTLAQFPRFKSSLDPGGENLVLKHYMHLGFAADTPNGLVVPVIRDADKKDVYELAAALGELSARAREGKLRPDDIQGGVFTVSSLGGIGGTFFTPVVNAPEVAILGVSRSQWRPVYREGEFVPRLILPLSLSYDHRVIDGADAVRFTTRLAATLAEVERLLEAVP